MLDADALYRQYSEIVYGYLLRLTRDGELAQELTQETFYQAIRKWKRFSGKSSVGTWLCAIAKNQYYSLLRKPVPLALEDIPEPVEPDFTESVADRSLASSAHKALHQLPEPYREVFTLRTFCDLSYREISSLFEKSESWARVTHYRARQMLADAMKGEAYGESVWDRP